MAHLYETSAGLTVSLPAPWTMKESSALARFQNLTSFWLTFWVTYMGLFVIISL